MNISLGHNISKLMVKKFHSVKVVKPMEDCDLCHGSGTNYTPNGEDDVDKNICECILRQEAKLEAVGG